MSRPDAPTDPDPLNTGEPPIPPAPAGPAPGPAPTAGAPPLATASVDPIPGARRPDEAASSEGAAAGPPRRLPVRRLVTLALCAAAAYVVLLQIVGRNANPVPVLERADLIWLVPALLAAAAGSLGSTLAIVGFVPERVSLRRALLAQLSGFFVNLATPGGLGSAAVNARFLARSGIPQTQALASVALGQIVGLVLHLALLVGFGTWIGADYAASVPTGASLLILVGFLAGVTAVGVGVPSLRHWLAARLREAGPRFRELLHQPVKLALGIAGQLAVTLMAAACLYCCARALGQYPGFAEVTVAQLLGSTVGSAVPTPGGIGSVDAALAYALRVTTGTPTATWVPVVLVYRLCTFWLPLLPGWASFLWLQRRRAL